MSAQEGKANPPSRAKWRVYRALAVLLILGLVAFVGPAFLNGYDGQHQIEVECSVGAARSLSGGSVTRTGLGSSSAEVKITTKNCGKLLLREGVSERNADRTARQLDAGGLPLPGGSRLVFHPRTAEVHRKKRYDVWLPNDLVSGKLHEWDRLSRAGTGPVLSSLPAISRRSGPLQAVRFNLWRQPGSVRKRPRAGAAVSRSVQRDLGGPRKTGMGGLRHSGASGTRSAPPTPGSVS